MLVSRWAGAALSLTFIAAIDGRLAHADNGPATPPPVYGEVKPTPPPVNGPVVLFDSLPSVRIHRAAPAEQTHRQPAVPTVEKSYAPIRMEIISTTRRLGPPEPATDTVALPAVSQFSTDKNPRRGYVSTSRPEYMHSPDYTVLTGELSFIASKNQWRLRFAPIDAVHQRHDEASHDIDHSGLDALTALEPNPATRLEHQGIKVRRGRRELFGVLHHQARRFHGSTRKKNLRAERGRIDRDRQSMAPEE